MVEVMRLEDQPPVPSGGASQVSNDEFASLPSSRHLWSVFDYTRQRGQMTRVTGDPGTSKTTTAKRYAAEHESVIYIAAAPDSRHMQPVMVAIGAAIVVNVYHSSSVIDGGPTPYDEKIHRLKTELATCRPSGGLLGRFLRPCLVNNVDLLIVDEAGLMIDEALELIRCLRDDTGIGVVLMGNATFPTRFNGRHGQARFAQLTSRFARREHLSGMLPEDYEAYFDHCRVRGRRARDLIRQHAEREGHLRTAAFIVTEAREKAPDGTLNLEHITAAIDELGLV